MALLKTTAKLVDADKLPGAYHSYLGQALARCERRYAEGVAACRRGVELAFYEPDNYLNLAWVHVLARERDAAMAAIDGGLAIDAQHAGLLALKKRLGVRRKPVIGFLPRAHPLNRKLGKLRHTLEQKRDED